MPHLSIRRKPSRKQRALSMAGTAGSAAVTFAKARIAWLAGKKAAKVAAPAVAVGTAAVVVKKRSGHRHDERAAPAGVNSVPPAPAGVA
ncbi:MAG TPA: hypothetical protein VK501_21350 [Baekduia sp.]|uniref:hypothetical protein n=1 Tax=Baekduia sp. TaxID=2600305 RepID=UPI002BF65723|nr:hypothetical protein [Baekduia sp.]HMJ36464.1 hypothetical protein [Baekduia sp.]